MTVFGWRLMRWGRSRGSVRLGYVGCYVAVLGWRVRIWGLLSDSLGSRLRTQGLLCNSFRLEAEDMGVVTLQF